MSLKNKISELITIFKVYLKKLEKDNDLKRNKTIIFTEYEDFLSKDINLDKLEKKYENLEISIKYFKQIMKFISENDIHTSDTLSSFSSKDIKEYDRLHTKFTNLYSEIVNLSNEEYKEDIIKIKEDYYKNKDIMKYKNSYNVILDLSKVAKKNEGTKIIEDLKDETLGAKGFRGKLANNLFYLYPHKINIEEYLGIKKFSLVDEYFSDASKLLKMNIIVINMTYFKNHVYEIFEDLTKILSPELVRKHKNVRPIKKTIYAGDEMKYFGSYEKTLVFKILNNEYIYLMTQGNDISKPEHDSFILRLTDRVDVYNKIFEEEFFKNNVGFNKELNLTISIPLMKFSMELRKCNTIECVLDTIKKQIKSLYDVDVYKYIKEYEELKYKMEKMLKEKKTLHQIIDELITENIRGNIYNQVRMIMVLD